MREKPLTEFMGSKKVAKEHGEKPAESKGLKGPWELPEGWKWVRIKDIARDTERVDPTKTPEVEFWYVDIASIDNTQYKILNPKKIKGKDAPSRARKRIQEGDVIFATTRPYLKNVAIVPEWLNSQVCSTGFAVLRAIPEKTIPKWLFYYLISDFTIEEIKPLMRGANYPAITDRDLFNLIIPLPPLHEQKRIVTKLDELNKRITEARELAEEARKEAEKLMASALHEVFSKAEERGWEWAKIKDIATDTERVNPTKTPDLEFWYIDIASIDNFTYQISKPKLLKGKEAPSRARKLVKAGDVIFATTRPYLRNIAIVPDWLDNQVCSTGFAVLRTIPEKTIPKWIFYYLISDFAIEQIKPMMRGANYPAITDRDLFNLKIPLPPLEEQKRIVSYLDSINERAQKLVKLYEEREKELENLFPAILDRAFRGEL